MQWCDKEGLGGVWEWTETGPKGVAVSPDIQCRSLAASNVYEHSALKLPERVKYNLQINAYILDESRTFSGHPNNSKILQKNNI